MVNFVITILAILVLILSVYQRVFRSQSQSKLKSRARSWRPDEDRNRRQNTWDLQAGVRA